MPSRDRRRRPGDTGTASSAPRGSARAPSRDRCTRRSAMWPEYAQTSTSVRSSGGAAGAGACVRSASASSTSNRSGPAASRADQLRRSACCRRCRSTRPPCTPAPSRPPTRRGSRSSCRSSSGSRAACRRRRGAREVGAVAQRRAPGASGTRRRRRRSARRRRADRSATQAQRRDSAPSSASVAYMPGELERRELDAADDQRQAVLAGRRARRRDAQPRELATNGSTPSCCEQIDERQVERARRARPAA